MKKIRIKQGSNESKQLLSILEQAEELLDDDKWVEAIDLLRPMQQKFPKDPQVLWFLAEGHANVKDFQMFAFYMEKLNKLETQNPNVIYYLAESYLFSEYFALALNAYAKYAKRWADHEFYNDAQTKMEELKKIIVNKYDTEGVPPEEVPELSIFQDKVRKSIFFEDAPRGIEIAKRALKKFPNYIPIINNLSTLFFNEADFKNALFYADMALKKDPQNVHALSNLVRFNFFSGYFQIAEKYAEELFSVKGFGPEGLYKIIEGLSLVAFHDKVLQIFERADKDAKVDEAPQAPMIYHLAAVAAYNSGDINRAHRLWEKGQKIDPYIYLINDNLDDLKKPVGERNGPWAFSLRYWFTNKYIDKIIKSSEIIERNNKKNVPSDNNDDLFGEHPELLLLAPVAFDRGDGNTRKFFILLNESIDNDLMLEYLLDFALGQKGSDDLRMTAVQIAARKKKFKDNKVRLWVKGEWRDIRMMPFEISFEPEEGHSPEVADMAGSAVEALRAGEYQKAKEILNKALALEPDSPDLLNNYALALEFEGKHEESFDLLMEIYEKYPDYLFATVSVSRIFIQDEEYEQAHELLDSLMKKQRMHYTEFESFCAAYIDLALAEEKKDVAASWLGMWQEVLPQSPNLQKYQKMFQDIE